MQPLSRAETTVLSPVIVFHAQSPEGVFLIGKLPQAILLGSALFLKEISGKIAESAVVPFAAGANEHPVAGELAGGGRILKRRQADL